MKTIGIVGGVAWPSSIVYYRTINEAVSRRLGDGGLHSANLVMTQTDFELIERSQRLGRWDIVGELLADQGRRLKAAGAAIADLASRGAEAVVLGCTEFGMLVSEEDSPIPLLDTSILHAEAAAELSLAG